MDEGFFSLTEIDTLRPPQSRAPKCGLCQLFRKCQTPYMKVAGKGERGIMIVGEAPGETEDARGKPFIGPAGKELQRGLAECGVDLFRDCWVTNTLACRPPNNRDPSPKELEYCRPNLVNAIDELKPTIIIPLGTHAVVSLFSWLWKKNPGKILRWAGFRVPCQELNAWICPTYHPSYLLHEESSVLTLLFRQHLSKACSLRNKPWARVPDFSKRVEVCLDVDDAAERLRDLLNKSETLAFDFETNMLKPHSPRSEIVSCAVSNGKRSIAFPWHGKPKKIMKEVLQDGHFAKVAANMKFEDSWTYYEFGFHVKNWQVDTMLTSHVLDNREDVSGLKFQSFARLGQREYDHHVSSYLKTKNKGGYEVNRIRQCPVRDLLHYNGMDSLLEYLLARIHSKELSLGDL